MADQLQWLVMTFDPPEQLPAEPILLAEEFDIYRNPGQVLKRLFFVGDPSKDS